MLVRIIILACKLLGTILQNFRLGAGGTWPGEIALKLEPRLIQKLSQQFNKGIIIVAGTNGKTTTSLMIAHCLKLHGDTVVHNATGANLLNGIAAALINNSNWKCAIVADWAVFEVDENSLPLLVEELISSSSTERSKSRSYTKENSRHSSNNTLSIVLLNLFRDQLDRYGEVDVIAQKWERAIAIVDSETTLVVNADDPLLVHLSNKHNNARYFGLTDSMYYLKGYEHATDSIYCLKCGAKLTYKGIYFSHLGDWKCSSCGFSKPLLKHKKHISPLHGVYNLYNTLAAYELLESIGLSNQEITQNLKSFKAAFGRQEELEWNGRKIQVYLSKNPAGFNASLRTIIEQNAKSILLVLNDRIPDGRDVSWIWDVDFEMIPEKTNLTVSGDRAYDMGLRIKYSENNGKLHIEPRIDSAIQTALNALATGETLYILPTYSAMLEVRKIVTGKKIL